MSRRSSHGSRRRRGGRGGSSFNFKAALKVGTIIGTVVMAGVVGGFVLHRDLTTEKIDTAYCYDREDQHEVAVFLDASFTASSSDAQWRDYETVLRRAYDEAPANARVSIFTTTNNVSKTLLEPVVSVCRPPATPAEQARINAPSYPAPYLARQSEEAQNLYYGLAAAVLRDAGNVDLQAADSPLLTTLQAVSRSRAFDSPNRTLWWVSDGIINESVSLACLVAGDFPPYPVFAGQERFERVRPEPFTGVDVRLMLVEDLVLPQPFMPHCTNAEIRRWWPLYFTENGAESVQMSELRRGVE